MTFELITIKREEILNRINEYIDSHKDKQSFNKELKKIFSINRVLGSILIEFTILHLMKYEDAYCKQMQTTTKIISEILNANNIRTGERIYEYRFHHSNKDDKTKMICTLYIERKDKQPDLYYYRTKEIFENFIEKTKDSDEFFYETVINKIDIAYKYAEYYINSIHENNIEFDEEKFIGELIYSLVREDSNEVFRQYNEINKKQLS